MEINWTEKLKPDLKSWWNSESTPGCPTQSIGHEHCLKPTTSSSHWDIEKSPEEMQLFLDNNLSNLPSSWSSQTLFQKPQNAKVYAWHWKNNKMDVCVSSLLFKRENYLALAQSERKGEVATMKIKFSTRCKKLKRRRKNKNLWSSVYKWNEICLASAPKNSMKDRKIPRYMNPSDTSQEGIWSEIHIMDIFSFFLSDWFSQHSSLTVLAWQCWHVSLK